MATITMHYKTKNDTNGNSRGCHVVYDATSKNGVLTAHDNNYGLGGRAKNIVAVYRISLGIPVEKHRNVVDSIEVPISIYNGFIKLGKELTVASN
jgi:hypothetical protein